MKLQTVLTERLGIELPIIQAPMAGGGDTPALVAAVSEAGGLGTIGAAYLTPAQIEEAGQTVRARTNRPFAINFFAPLPVPALPKDPDGALARVAPYYAELGLPPPALPPESGGTDIAAQIEAALGSGAAVVSFTFGMLPDDALIAIRKRGLFLAGTATTLGEARALEEAEVDAIVVQGSEAGGHRGSFVRDFESSVIGTMALVPQVVDAVRLPVIAAGGIMDGRGIAAALALGAAGVQMGTAFLTTDEAGVPEAYKTALMAARGDDTRITRAFSGRPARGVVNRFMAEIDAAGEGAILPFPLQNALTRPLRTAAAKAERAEFLSLWAGQGVGLARRLPAAALVERLTAETEATLGRMAARMRDR